MFGRSESFGAQKQKTGFREQNLDDLPSRTSVRPEPVEGSHFFFWRYAKGKVGASKGSARAGFEGIALMVADSQDAVTRRFAKAQVTFVLMFLGSLLVAWAAFAVSGFVFVAFLVALFGGVISSPNVRQFEKADGGWTNFLVMAVMPILSAYMVYRWFESDHIVDLLSAAFFGGFGCCEIGQKVLRTDNHERTG